MHTYIQYIHTNTYIHTQIHAHTHTQIYLFTNHKELAAVDKNKDKKKSGKPARTPKVEKEDKGKGKKGKKDKGKDVCLVIHAHIANTTHIHTVICRACTRQTQQKNSNYNDTTRVFSDS